MTVPVWPEKQVPAINYAMIDLMECVCDALAELGQGPVCNCVIHAGETVSWDYCGECDHGVCGMSFIRPDSAFTSTAFPQADGAQGIGCDAPIVYAVDVGVLRCFPTMDEDGEQPETALITEASLLLMEDQAAIRTAIQCCESRYLKTKLLTQWEPMGPAGGCVGGFWTLFIDPAPWGS